MAATVLVTVEEYLRTSYRPDCDYVDGEVRERRVGEFEHSSTQGEVYTWLRGRFGRGRVLPEQRVQVKPRGYRVPDVCVLAEGAPRERIVHTPPALCVEILSRDDKMTEIMERVSEYLDMGVPVCWIIDPKTRKGWMATPGQLLEATDGVLRAGGLEMPLNEVLL